MPERLTPLEASLLALDTARTPAHLGTVTICAVDPDVFVDERVTALIRERIAYVPRYRQRVSRPAAGLAGTYWVDDGEFDLSYHVQCLALPGPGTAEQLEDLVADLLARPLDHSRPLWEAYLVEGLADGRCALVTKSHLSLVTGTDTVEITQVLLDDEPDAAAAPVTTWQPSPEAPPLALLGRTLARAARDGAFASDTIRVAVTGALGSAVGLAAEGGVNAAVGQLAEEALRRGPRPARSPFGGSGAGERRLATAKASLADLRTVSARHAVSGALRDTLLARGASLSPGRVLTALVPMAVTESGSELSAVGCDIIPRLHRLPVGEPDPLVRLQVLAYATRAHRAGGRAVEAQLLSDLAGFAPPTLTAMAARAAGDSARPHDVAVVNVPGPRAPRYLAGAEVVETYSVLPPSNDRPVSISATSYNGKMFFCVSDQDGPELAVLVSGLERAASELVESVGTVNSGLPG